MGRYTLCFILLLPFTFCSYDQDNLEPVVKTVGKESDLTPVCSNSTLDPILFVVCRIRAVRSREEECRVSYRLERGFEQGCDSRFSLTIKHQTMFLHLNNLRPENSGSYSCDCSRHDGTLKLQFNVTVEDDKDTIPPPETISTSNQVILLGVFLLIVVILLGIISICCCRNKNNRRKVKILTWTEVTSTVLYLEAAVAEPYLKQEVTKLYSEVRMTCCQTTNQ